LYGRWKEKHLLKMAEQFAIHLEETIEDLDAATFGNTFDMYNLVMRGSHNGKISAETAADPQASEFVKGVLSQQILLGLRDNIFLKKLNTRLVDDRVFILFRMTSNAGLMNYIEFEVKELDDKMKVVD